MTVALLRLFNNSAITQHLLRGADRNQLAGFQDQCAGQRHTLRLASREAAHISFLIPRQADEFQQCRNLLREKPLTMLPWPECQVRCHGPGEEIRDLHDHANATPQLSWCQCPEVLTVEA